MGVAPEDEPGLGPVSADTADHVLDERTDLGAGRRIARAQATLCLVQQNKPAVREDQAPVEGSSHFLARNGWQPTAKKANFDHGGACLVRCAENARFDNKSLSDANGLHHVRHLRIRNAVNKPGYTQ